MMRRKPIPMTTSGLADTLAALAESIRKGDSLEGSFEYLLPDPYDEHDCDTTNGGCPHVMVMASYRVGNLQGQGGMRMIGEWMEGSGGSAATDSKAMRRAAGLPETDNRCPGRVVAYADGRTGRCRKGAAGHPGECE